MPLTEESNALATRADKTANDLHTNWLLQLAVGFIGFLYLIKSPMAESLASSLRLELELVRIVVPIASV